MRILTLLCACLLLPSVSLATVFSPTFTDKSVQLLGVIFGTHVGPIHLGGPANPALLHMFEMLNTVVITLGVTVVSYVGFVSTINTAQEGQAMGRKWSSFWIPMRSALGMLTMIPTPTSGYSVIQTSVMWLIMQGIGAADQIWNTILYDMSHGMSPATGIHLNKENEDYKTVRTHGVALTNDMMLSAVCKQTLNDIANNVTKSWRPPGVRATYDNIYAKHLIGYEVTGASSRTADQAYQKGDFYVGIQGHPVFGDICGRYSITSVVNRDDFPDNWAGSDADLYIKALEIYHEKLLVLQSMLANLSNVADVIVAEQATPRDRNNRLYAPIDRQTIQPAGARDMAINIYTKQLSALIMPYEISDYHDVVRDGQLSGWISAGSFYNTMNHVNTQYSNHYMRYFPTVTLHPSLADPYLIPRCDDEAHCTGHLDPGAQVLSTKLREHLDYNEHRTHLAHALWDAEVYLQNDDSTVLEQLNAHLPAKDEARFHVSDPENFAKFKSLQSKARQLLVKAMGGGHHDPLIAQGSFGTDLMVSAEQWLLELIIDQQVRVNNAAQDPSLITPSLREAISNANQIGVLSLGIFSIVWSVGALLSIYLPLIPYMIFTVAVVGWFLLVIEAVVAAPILALSFILPAGEELGKVVQGLMILLNIVLRPILMLFGFILATRLYKAVIMLVNFSILSNFETLDTSSSLFAWLGTLGLYGGFIVALTNKCFSLIYALPDKILRWMGGPPEHSDVSQELGQAKGALSKASDSSEKIATGAAEREFARIQSRANHILSPADAVRGGGSSNSS